MTTGVKAAAMHSLSFTIAPGTVTGFLLDAKAVHPGRSARSHLRSMAATHNIKASRSARSSR
jgi:hypothetical protein